jgi:hypothetical protein
MIEPRDQAHDVIEIGLQQAALTQSVNLRRQVAALPLYQLITLSHTRDFYLHVGIMI